MKIVWYRNGKGPADNAEEKHLPAESQPQVPRKLSPDWMEDVVTRYEQEGGFANLEGKGKPLDLSGDNSFEGMVNRIFKDAGALPRWVQLQREICSDLEKAVELKQMQSDIEPQLHRINEKIRQYNAACPSALLQKPLVHSEGLEQALERWR
jgi:Domain of unknown function (DUF1992)